MLKVSLFEMANKRGEHSKKVCVRNKGTKCWSQKDTLIVIKFCSKRVCAEILSERAIKNELKEI